jgi:hypothetical protein
MSCHGTSRVALPWRGWEASGAQAGERVGAGACERIGRGASGRMDHTAGNEKM